ncbi:RNA polymerase sporulation sigma factor SigK [Lachnospiraceae bacterium HCP1S3_C3]|nr:RNA polymerase sporulation sigma factor SigK [Lachnospiraceae bacterium]MDD6858291.1 RNA polymerase sporulation sigma factor SigK [Lachnospiraceae bacterium]
MKTFSKPLTRHEEEKYLKEFQDGSQTARNILIERNMRLVAHISKKYHKPGRDMEDILSVGTIGLIKAVNSFEISKGRLATYAAKCIENEILMMLRNEKKKMKEISLFEPIGLDKDGNDISLIDVIEISEKEVYEKCELKQNIINLYKIFDVVLNEREKDIIYSRYGLAGRKELTQRQLAQKYHISRSYISRIEKKALLKLREGLEKI